ncbi:MAG: tetratricopeptide repeat protein [Pirellulales bacterium]
MTAGIHCVALIALGLLLVPPLAAQEAEKPKADEAQAKPPEKEPEKKPDKLDRVLDSFLKSVSEDKSLDEAKRRAVLTLVEAQRADADRRVTAITDALAAVNDDFRGALAALAAEDVKTAIGALEKLVAAKDEYLAAEAAYFLARALVIEERCEDALPLLEKLTKKMADQSMYSGDAQFLLGVCHLQLLDRRQAISALEKFLKDYPDAPERLRVGAYRQVEELKGMREGSLVDVHDRMGFSRRKLQLEDSGQKTRSEQDKIIAMLDVLIKEAEDREKGGT